MRSLVISKIYENKLLAGDLNVDLRYSKKHHSVHLLNLIDSFNLTNLVKGASSFNSQKGSLIDVLLTNKPKLFQKIQSFVTGITGCYKLVATFL